jgi:RNA polymerase sigma factor (sigma-70 family)
VFDAILCDRMPQGRDLLAWAKIKVSRWSATRLRGVKWYPSRHTFMPGRPNTQLDLDMARLADGDREAFSSVFRALWPVLVPFCRRAVGPGPDADDAAQLALEKIFARANEYDPSRPALAWAFTIAAWECTTIRRRRQRSRTSSVGEVEALSVLPNPEELTIAEDLKHALEDAVAQLSPTDRETIDAAFWDDALKGATDPAFRKRKERALSRLRALWSKLREP